MFLISQFQLSTGLAYAYWFMILLTAIILLFFGLSQLQLIRKLTHVVMAGLNHCEFRLRQLEGCQMENLPIIRQLIQEENYPQLTATFEAFEQDSEKLFHGKWTADLRRYFDREHLLTRSQFHRLSPNWAYRYLSSGLFLTAFFVFTSLSLGDPYRLYGLPLAILPGVVGSCLFYFMYYRSDLSRKALDQAMRQLGDTAALRLPTFSDLAGSAVLVDAFMQYDRKMAHAVERLSQSVSGLLNEQLVEAVSQSVLRGMHEALLPPIQQSHQVLGDLAGQLTSRQEQGMRQLADQFSTHVADVLARRLEVFFRELDLYLNQLRETKGEVEQALSTLDQYRTQAQALDAQLTQHLSTLQQQGVENTQRLAQMAEAQTLLASTSERLAELQQGSGHSLTGLIGDLGQKVTGFAQSMTHLTKEIREENQANRQSIDHLLSAQKQTLDQYQQLSETLVTGSQSLNRQADLIHRQMEVLNGQLNQSVQQFGQAMNEGVTNLLNTFDQQLADVSDRLSSTTAEIQSTSDRLLQAQISADSAHDSRKGNPASNKA